MSPTLSSDPAGGRRLPDEGAVRELHAVAAILESLAVRLAPPFTAPRRAALRAANARLRAAEDPVSAAIADRDVHRGLVAACGHEALLDTLGPVEATLRRLPAIDGAGAVARHAAEHDAIIDALAEGDNELASRRLRAHVGDGLDGLLRALRTRVATVAPGS